MNRGIGVIDNLGSKQESSYSITYMNCIEAGGRVATHFLAVF
jgi:hypothetical protein